MSLSFLGAAGPRWAKNTDFFGQTKLLNFLTNNQPPEGLFLVTWVLPLLTGVRGQEWDLGAQIPALILLCSCEKGFSTTAHQVTSLRCCQSITHLTDIHRTGTQNTLSVISTGAGKIDLTARERLEQSEQSSKTKQPQNQTPFPQFYVSYLVTFSVIGHWVLFWHTVVLALKGSKRNPAICELPFQKKKPLVFQRHFM